MSHSEEQSDEESLQNVIAPVCNCSLGKILDSRFLGNDGHHLKFNTSKITTKNPSAIK
jgi:hypothetical protein